MAEAEIPSPEHNRRLWYSAIAVVVAATVLIGVLAVRLASPGTRMAEASAGGASPIGPVCTHYPGAEVSIVAPAVGKIVVSAMVGVGVRHFNGINDTALIVVAATSTDCTLNNYSAFVSVPETLPSNPSYFETVPIVRPFAIPAAGTYAFYVNAAMVQGWDPNDRFDSASLVAVYYPS